MHNLNWKFSARAASAEPMAELVLLAQAAAKDLAGVHTVHT